MDCQTTNVPDFHFRNRATCCAPSRFASRIGLGPRSQHKVFSRAAPLTARRNNQTAHTVVAAAL